MRTPEDGVGVQLHDDQEQRGVLEYTLEALQHLLEHV